MDNNGDSVWIVTTVVIGTIFCVVIIAVYLYRQGVCCRSKWSKEKPHIHSRGSLDEIEDPTVMVSLLPNGTTIHSVSYFWAAKKKEATVKLSKAIPNEYQSNIIAKAVAYVSRREGFSQQNLNGVFVSGDTLLVSYIKYNALDDIEEDREEGGEENAPEPTWWG